MLLRRVPPKTGWRAFSCKEKIKWFVLIPVAGEINVCGTSGVKLSTCSPLRTLRPRLEAMCFRMGGLRRAISAGVRGSALCGGGAWRSKPSSATRASKTCRLCACMIFSLRTRGASGVRHVLGAWVHEGNAVEVVILLSSHLACLGRGDPAPFGDSAQHLLQI